jgi:hypothetical protein
MCTEGTYSIKKGENCLPCPTLKEGELTECPGGSEIKIPPYILNNFYILLKKKN